MLVISFCSHMPVIALLRDAYIFCFSDSSWYLNYNGIHVKNRHIIIVGFAKYFACSPIV